MQIVAHITVVDMDRHQTVAHCHDGLILVDRMAVGVPHIPAEAEHRMVVETAAQFVEIGTLEEIIERTILTAGVFRVDAHARFFGIGQQLAVKTCIGVHEFLAGAVPLVDRMHHHPGNAQNTADLHFPFQHFDAPVPLRTRIDAAAGSMRLHEVHAGFESRLTDAFRPFPPMVRTHRRAFEKGAVHGKVDMAEAAFCQQGHRGGGIAECRIIPEISGRGSNFHDLILSFSRRQDPAPDRLLTQKKKGASVFQNAPGKSVLEKLIICHKRDRRNRAR